MSYIVTGPTYMFRERMRAMGGRWDRNDKGWRFTLRETAERAAAIVGAGAVILDATPPAARSTIPQPTQVASDAIDPARTILSTILAVLPPRKLADALLAVGWERNAAESLAVQAAECIRMPKLAAV